MEEYEVSCPHCKQTLLITPIHFGYNFVCPNCKNTISIDANGKVMNAETLGVATAAQRKGWLKWIIILLLLLLSAGAGTFYYFKIYNQKSYDIYTAIYNGQVDIVREKFANGEYSFKNISDNIIKEETNQKKSLLFYLVNSPADTDTKAKIFDIFLANGFNPNSKVNTGRLIITEIEDREIETSSQSDRKPYSKIRNKQEIEKVEAHVKSSKTQETKSEMNPPLLFAYNQKEYWLMQKLLEVGADCNIAIDDENTPIFYDCYFTEDQTALDIIIDDPRLDAANEYGSEILDYFVINNNEDICKKLQKRGAKISDIGIIDIIKKDNEKYFQLLFPYDNYDDFLYSLTAEEFSYKIMLFMVEHDSQKNNRRIYAAITLFDSEITKDNIATFARNINEYQRAGESDKDTIDRLVEGEPLLHYLLAKKKYELFFQCIALGASLNIKNAKKQNIVDFAISNGCDNSIMLRILDNLQSNILSQQSLDVLFEIVMISGEQSHLEKLTQLGINFKDPSKVIEAIKNNRYDLANKLFEFGADFSLLETRKNSAIFEIWQQYNNSSANEEIKTLIDKIPESAYIAQEKQGYSLLLYAISKDFASEITEQIYEKCANRIENDQDGKSPLILACTNDNIATVKYLLNKKLKPNVIGAHGLTPLIAACNKNNIEIAKILIEHNADINYSNIDGDTPLMIATKNQNDSFVDFFLKNGALLNSKNKNGETALFFTAKNDNINIAKKLLTAGADFQIKNNNGQDAADVAAYHRCTDIVYLLGEANNEWIKNNRIKALEEGKLGK